MSKASNEYIQVSDSKINEIVRLLSSWKYDSKEWGRLTPYIAQMLCNNGIAIESTCLILSEITDITNVEGKIKELYSGNNIPYLESDMIEFLGDEKYSQLLKQIISEDYSNKIYRGELDPQTYITINMRTRQVFYCKRSNKKNGQDTFTPVIEAVPEKLIVYDSAITDQPRNFKITWTSKYSKRQFSVTGEGLGANLTEIKDYVIEAGYSHNSGYVQNVVACMINTLIEEGFAQIRTDIDNLGVYYKEDNEQVIVVKADMSEPSEEEMLDAIDVLEDLTNFFRGDEDVLASVFKWSLMSIFSYAMKQVGNWLPYLYLKGSAGSGKTTLGKIALYTYDTPNAENNMGGSSFNTEFRIGKRLSDDCTARLVNEPAAVFKRDAPKELVKVCVESITSRRIQGKVYPAFSPVIFTANQYLPDDDALIRRMYVLAFTHNQRKSEEEKQAFKQMFHVDTPSMSRLNCLHAFGRFAIRTIVSDPSLLFDDWQKTADFILDEFYAMALVDKPSWLKLWSETETLDDFDENQREEFRSFFVDEFNRARGRIDIRDEYGNKKGTTLDDDNSSEAIDFEDIIWAIVNERMISWAIPSVGRDNTKYVCLTQTLKKALKQHMDYSNDLKSIGELLDWDYKNVRFGDKTKWVVKVPFDDFICFLYPSIGE